MSKRARVWDGSQFVDIVGPQGPQGPQGLAGADGQGVPSGGNTGQILSKTSATDYATQWIDAPTGASARTTATYTTGSIAHETQETGTVALAKSYRILKIQADRACRVRIYDTTAHRASDASRAIGTDPTGDHGLMLEYVFTAAATVTLTPTVDGFNNESTPTANIPINITNRSGVTTTVAVTFTFISTEE